MVSSTCFEHPSVHPLVDLYMQVYGIYFMHPYKQDILSMSECVWYHKYTDIDQTANIAA